MQGTVKEFHEETRSGSVLLDDGTEVALPAEAFATSGLRKLVLGQRVQIVLTGDGDDRRITSVNIPTL